MAEELKKKKRKTPEDEGENGEGREESKYKACSSCRAARKGGTHCRQLMRHTGANWDADGRGDVALFRKPQVESKPRPWKQKQVEIKLAGSTDVLYLWRWESDETRKIAANDHASVATAEDGSCICTHEGCGKSFPDKAAFRQHLAAHGRKLFTCPVEGCGKTFLESSRLKRHSLVHTGIRPYTCPVETCGKCFSLDFNLRSHLRAVHGHTYSTAWQAVAGGRAKKADDDQGETVLLSHQLEPLPPELSNLLN